jgi:LysM repeat protein
MAKIANFGLLALAAVVLLSACSIVSDGDADTSDVRVTQAVMTAAINEQGQATAPGRIFPANTQRIFAVLNLEGVKPGVEITGKWFQTSVENVPAEGSEVHSSAIKLDEKTATPEGRSRVALFLPATTQGIPEDSWVLRVYAGDKLIRTMAFVVAGTAQGSSPPATNPGTNPAPAGTNPAPAPVPTPRTYTVVAGDTLNALALRFKPPAEDVNAYTQRLRQANNRASDNLSPGQVLRIP